MTATPWSSYEPRYPTCRPASPATFENCPSFHGFSAPTSFIGLPAAEASGIAKTIRPTTTSPAPRANQAMVRGTARRAKYLRIPEVCGRQSFERTPRAERRSPRGKIDQPGARFAELWLVGPHWRSWLAEPCSSDTTVPERERAEASGPRHEGTSDTESASAACLEPAGSKSVPSLWVERPGQDLNLRGVTQRFSRPPPYRARRPGQRFILKPKARISVSDPGHHSDARKPCATRPTRC